jgi:hypothetical protein
LSSSRDEFPIIPFLGDETDRVDTRVGPDVASSFVNYTKRSDIVFDLTGEDWVRTGFGIRYARLENVLGIDHMLLEILFRPKSTRTSIFA